MEQCSPVCGWGGPGTAFVPTMGGGGAATLLLSFTAVPLCPGLRAGGEGGFSPTPLIANCSLPFSSPTIRNEGPLRLQPQWHRGVPNPPPTHTHCSALRALGHVSTSQGLCV